MKNIEKYFDAIDTLTSAELLRLVCSAESMMRDVTGQGCCGSEQCDTCMKKVKEWLFSEALPDKPKLTRFEKEILLNLEGNYRYIARDENGSMWCFYGMPSKDKHAWKSISHYDALKPFNELFDFIQWEDEKPALIEDLLKLEVISYE